MASTLALHVQDVCSIAKEDRMAMKAIRKAQQMTVDEIATIAATRVARALAAHHAVGVALSSEELLHVNEGVTLTGSVKQPYPIFVGSRWSLVPPPRWGIYAAILQRSGARNVTRPLLWMSCRLN
jgi:hypothetical protein